MSETEACAMPEIQFAPERVIPYDVKSELQASLTYLAHRLNRPIVVRPIPHETKIEHLPATIRTPPACHNQRPRGHHRSPFTKSA